MTKIKVCGLLDSDTAVLTAEAGADFLGFVFAPSPRQISPEQALQVIKTLSRLNPRPATVGVFVNLAYEKVNRIAEQCQVDWVQLSGDETWAYCQEIKRPIIKVMHVTEDKKAARILADIKTGSQLLVRHKVIFMLDTHSSSAYGGSGKSFNWELARKIVQQKKRVVVAGGLSLANVASLICTVRPWGVDVSSGVETHGEKDLHKIRSFIQCVRAADRQINQVDV